MVTISDEYARLWETQMHIVKNEIVDQQLQADQQVSLSSNTEDIRVRIIDTITPG